MGILYEFGNHEVKLKMTYYKNIAIIFQFVNHIITGIIPKENFPLCKSFYCSKDPLIIFGLVLGE